MAKTGAVRIRRVYDEAGADDAARILVDRIWLRGPRKDDAHIYEWCKQIAPSTELRTGYGHDPEKFDEFTRRYHDRPSFWPPAVTSHPSRRG
jgi:uncharacterized protein YeaO (DUF488 family)